MEAVLIDFKDNEADIKIKEEDVSIMYILQHELLQNKKVEFAGVAMKHPLTKEYEMRVVTESGNPLDVLLEAVKTACEYVEDLTQMFKKVKG
ncbi:MAG: RpoL/Rpb11 RNA polymerase subunit family protein [Nitrososphaerales archaeon]